MNIKEYITSGIIEQYVSGLCSKEEEQELETLRRQYPELHTAIEQYEAELEINMLRHVTLPSVQTDEKILATLDKLGTPVLPLRPVINNKSSWLSIAAAAAVLLLLASSYFNYVLYNKTKQRERTLNNDINSLNSLPPGDYAIITNPTITPVAMYGVGTHSICRCTMFWDKKTGKTYIIIHHLPKSSASKDYQLWAIVNGSPVNIGIINDEIRGRFIEMQNVPPNANAFIVTLEKVGGTSIPTIEETYLSGKI